MKVVSFFESIKIWWWVEKVQAGLSVWLVDLWYEFIHLVLKDKSPKNEYKWKIVSLNEEFIFGFWFKKIISLFLLWHKVAKWSNKEKVDVIIWQWDFFYMVIWVSKLLFWNRSKCIWVVHTTIWIWPWYIKKILIYLLKRLDKIVLISKEEYNTFINIYWFKKENLELIYNSIDLEQIELKLQEKLPEKYKSLFDDSKFTFINVWRLTHQKNQKLLLQAFDLVNNKYKNTQLIILWDWELKDELYKFRDSLNSKNDIYFLWNQENIFPFLKKSDCFVLSSQFEGFWLVLTESMAIWLPIISTNCPTWPSEILNWEMKISDLQITENAVLVPYNCNTEEFLVKAMEKIYLDQNLRKNLSENNISRVKDFDKEEIMKKWKRVIDNL